MNPKKARVINRSIFTKGNGCVRIRSAPLQFRAAWHVNGG